MKFSLLKAIFNELILCFMLLCSSPVLSQNIFGMTTGVLTPEQRIFLNETKEYLEEKFGKNKIQFIQPTSLNQLRKLIEQKKIDYFFSTAGFSRFINQSGSKELLTYTDNRFPDGQKSLGSTFFVRRDSGIKTFHDLKDKIFIANWPSGFYSLAVPFGELKKQGITDPYKYFKKIIFINKTPGDLFSALLSGRGDAIALPSCFWEESFPQGSPEREFLVPIGIKERSPCIRSSDTYPNWAISATANSDPAFTRLLVKALLQMPSNQFGSSWSILTDYSEVDSLFKELKIGPYTGLRQWSWKNFLNENILWVISFALFLLCLLILLTYLYFQLHKKTKLLVRSLNEQIRASDEAHRAKERFNALQKVGAIGQMSSMIAHELRQPIGAIQAYGEGLLRAHRKGILEGKMLQETLDQILQQNKRSGEIVDRVRKYAKKEKVEKRIVSIEELVNSAIETFLPSVHLPRKSIKVENLTKQGIKLWVEPLELELALCNLMKNSVEAMDIQNITNPKVFIRLSSSESTFRIDVFDSGLPMADTLYESIATPLNSEKEQGLGLGLSIVKSIVIRHGGKVKFSRDPVKKNFIVSLFIPIIENNHIGTSTNN